jgi:hypothetical protein
MLEESNGNDLERMELIIEKTPPNLEAPSSQSCGNSCVTSKENNHTHGDLQFSNNDNALGTLPERMNNDGFSRGKASSEILRVFNISPVTDGSQQLNYDETSRNIPNQNSTLDTSYCQIVKTEESSETPGEDNFSILARHENFLENNKRRSKDAIPTLGSKEVLTSFPTFVETMAGPNSPKGSPTKVQQRKTLKKRFCKGIRNICCCCETSDMDVADIQNSHESISDDPNLADQPPSEPPAGTSADRIKKYHRDMARKQLAAFLKTVKKVSALAKPPQPLQKDAEPGLVEEQQLGTDISTAVARSTIVQPRNASPSPLAFQNNNYNEDIEARETRDYSNFLRRMNGSYSSSSSSPSNDDDSSSITGDTELTGLSSVETTSTVHVAASQLPHWMSKSQRLDGSVLLGPKSQQLLLIQDLEQNFSRIISGQSELKNHNSKIRAWEMEADMSNPNLTCPLGFNEIVNICYDIATAGVVDGIFPPVREIQAIDTNHSSLPRISASNEGESCNLELNLSKPLMEDDKYQLTHCTPSHPQPRPSLLEKTASNRSSGSVVSAAGNYNPDIPNIQAVKGTDKGPVEGSQTNDRNPSTSPPMLKAVWVGESLLNDTTQVKKVYGPMIGSFVQEMLQDTPDIILGIPVAAAQHGLTKRCSWNPMKWFTSKKEIKDHCRGRMRRSYDGGFSRPGADSDPSIVKPGPIRWTTSPIRSMKEWSLARRRWKCAGKNMKNFEETQRRTASSNVSAQYEAANSGSSFEPLAPTIVDSVRVDVVFGPTSEPSMASGTIPPITK